MEKVKEVLSNRVSRRKFMAGIGAGVGATAAVALASGCSSSGNSSTATGGTTTTTTPVTDLAILQFALSLEFLGAEYYLNGLTGSGVPSSIAGSSAGAVTGAAQVPGLAGSPFAVIVADLAQDEIAHIVTLQAAISAMSGATPVSRPAINFTTGFNGIATLAGISGNAFNPFTSASNFLLGAFSFEDVDVSAYTGAAPLISSAAVLNAAAGIQAVEAYHAGIIRTAIVATDSLNGNTTLTGLANQIQTARATLGGGMETMLGPTSIVSATSANAIGYARTTDEVLHIVYGTAGGAGVSSGGFFPSGINGTITTTAS